MKNLLEATQSVDRGLSSARGEAYSHDAEKIIAAMEELEYQKDLVSYSIKKAKTSGNKEDEKQFWELHEALQTATKALRKAIG